MSYNILGINTSHNSSICVLSDGKIKFFLEEDRLSRRKFDNFPIELLMYISKKYHINQIAMGGLDFFPTVNVIDEFYSESYLSKEGDYIIVSDQKLLYQKNNSEIPKIFSIPSLWEPILSKYFKNVPIIDFQSYHHKIHALTSFFNSGFKESYALIIDGTGSLSYNINKNIRFETESIFKCTYKDDIINPIFKSYREFIPFSDKKTYPSMARCYEIITYYLGFKDVEAGKTMGLSSYGKLNSKIPPLLINGKGNPEFFNPQTLETNLNVRGNEIKEKYKYLFENPETRNDIAFRIQYDCEILVEDMVKILIKKENPKNICCAGGFFLNCVNNYKLVKKFPQINFYFEPLAHDAGLSIGAAKTIHWLSKSKDTTIRPQKTLYYGPKYSKEELLRKIDKYLD